MIGKVTSKKVASFSHCSHMPSMETTYIHYTPSKKDFFPLKSMKFIPMDLCFSCAVQMDGNYVKNTQV